MLLPEHHTLVSYPTFVVTLICYCIAMYFSIKIISKNKNEDHAENL